jgi:hypothetical protein
MQQAARFEVEQLPVNVEAGDLDVVRAQTGADRWMQLARPALFITEPRSRRTCRTSMPGSAFN